MERLYNLVAVNDKTGKRELLTAYPDTHENCVIIKSKQAQKPKGWPVRVIFEEVVSCC